MKRLFIILLLLIATNAHTQDIKRTQNWYFGDSAGLSFATEPPTVLTNGAMYTIEGCATISDTSGNLLFYTNGVTVWNSAHQVMENGTGLNGHVSSTQSSIIVPWPGNDSLFYIFTTDAVGQFNGLQYSVVNIKENNGLGKVIIKNILLHTPVCEKLTAYKHNDGSSIWVLCHEFNTNNFIIYLINSEGINTCPIVQSAGSVNGINSSDAQGMMKINASGKLLANVVFDQSKIELFSFDSETALIQYKYTLDGLFFPFSVEFSDSLYLYVLDRSKNIYQYNLNLINENSIKQSKTILGTSNALFSNAMQRSLDKIYIAVIDSFFLASIESPNKLGLGANFNLKGIQLGNAHSISGLPNFISSYFYAPQLTFDYTFGCDKDSIYLKAISKAPLISPTWSIFKNSSLIYSVSNIDAAYSFSDTGGYTVRLISGTDTVLKSIYIQPKLKLGKDTVICNQQAFKLIVPSNYRCINWQDGSDSINYAVTQTGKYFVSANNIKGCLVSDTINIIFTTLPPPVITKRHDTLFTDSGSYTFNWKYNGNPIGGNSNFIVISQNGNYSVEVTDTNGCTNTSSTFPVTGLNILLLDANSYFLIYPIPATDKLFIQPNGNIIIESLLLRDITGRTLEYSPATELSVQGLSKGIYLLEITDHSKTKYVSKIIIH